MTEPQETGQGKQDERPAREDPTACPPECPCGGGGLFCEMVLPDGGDNFLVNRETALSNVAVIPCPWARLRKAEAAMAIGEQWMTTIQQRIADCQLQAENALRAAEAERDRLRRVLVGVRRVLRMWTSQGVDDDTLIATANMLDAALSVAPDAPAKEE